LFAIAAVVSACEQTAGPEPQVVEIEPSFWEGCEASNKFTGGGRIDPFGQKITFGFNVHAEDVCDPGDPGVPGIGSTDGSGEIKGNLQVVHHPTRSKYHSTSITRFASFSTPKASAASGRAPCGPSTGAAIGTNTPTSPRHVTTGSREAARAQDPIRSDSASADRGQATETPVALG
jgi:hypothetical protein